MAISISASSTVFDRELAVAGAGQLVVLGVVSAAVGLSPLGWVATVDEHAKLLDLCRERGLWLVADEVYERIFYGGPLAPSVLRLATGDDMVLVVQSFSKTYCMTGWRVGWLVGPRTVAEKLAQLNEFVVSHAPTFLQVAAETAIELGEPWVAEMVESFRQNRDYCSQAVAGMPGVSLPRPEGAFYLFPRIDGLADSFDFGTAALTEQTDQSMLAQAATTRYDRFMGPSTKARVVYYVIGHTWDIYGQMVVYVRLNGILPPTALPRPGRGGN